MGGFIGGQSPESWDFEGSDILASLVKLIVQSFKDLFNNKAPTITVNSSYNTCFELWCVRRGMFRFHSMLVLMLLPSLTHTHTRAHDSCHIRSWHVVSCAATWQTQLMPYHTICSQRILRCSTFTHTYTWSSFLPCFLASVYMFVCSSPVLLVCLSACLFASSFVASLFRYSLTSLFVCLFVCLFACLLVHVSVLLFVRCFVRQSVRPCTYTCWHMYVSAYACLVVSDCLSCCACLYVCYCTCYI